MVSFHHSAFNPVILTVPVTGFLSSLTCPHLLVPPILLQQPQTPSQSLTILPSLFLFVFCACEDCYFHAVWQQGLSFHKRFQQLSAPIPPFSYRLTVILWLFLTPYHTFFHPLKLMGVYKGSLLLPCSPPSSASLSFSVSVSWLHPLRQTVNPDLPLALLTLMKVEQTVERGMGINVNNQKGRQTQNHLKVLNVSVFERCSSSKMLS